MDSNSNNQQAELAFLQWRDSLCTQLLKQRLDEYKEQVLNEIKFKSVDAVSPDNVIRYRAAQLKTIDDILGIINERGNIIRSKGDSPRPESWNGYGGRSARR